MNEIPTAVYKEPEIEEYRDQPLINALPLINSPQKIAKLLNRYPKVRESEKILPGYIRRHAMMRLLDEFLYPTKTHLQLEQMISTIIRRGYLKRNIFSVEYQLNLNEVDKLDFSAIANSRGNTAFTTSVIGCSGTGKSTAVEAILGGYDEQAIYHPKYQHIQLVWLKLDCPHDGSVKSLCIHFFREVDKVLGSNYEKLYVKARSSAESMLGDIARVAALHSIGLLVIDEIQNLRVAVSGGANKLLNFFVTLNNVIKVPVLFIGTPNALSLFSPTLRSARRSAQIGALIWNRFEHSKGGEKDAEWDKFILRMWKLQWFRYSTPLTKQMKDIFWEYTQGIAHVAVVLFYLCQTRAVMAQREYIDQDLVEQVFHEDLSIISPMIKALQSGRESEIASFTDLEITCDTVPALIENNTEIVSLLDDMNSQLKDKSTGLIEMLIKMGLGDDIAPLVAAQAIEEKPDEDLFGLVAHVKFLQDKTPKIKSSEKKPPSIKPCYIEQDLRLFHDKEPLKSYLNLKRDGIIIDIDPYL